VLKTNGPAVCRATDDLDRPVLFEVVLFVGLRL
jgi:hypothetical protein